jgi:uncharacterized membrane protein (DUF2068 family)
LENPTDRPTPYSPNGKQQTETGVWLIIIYKFISGLLSIFVGMVLLGLSDEDLMAIGQTIGNKLQLNPNNPLIGAIIELVSQITPQQLGALALISFILGALSITGALGLWLGKNWGDYLVIITVAVFMPFLIVGLLTDFDPVSLIIFILDVAVVWYLVARLLRRRAQDAG